MLKVKTVLAPIATLVASSEGVMLTIVGPVTPSTTSVTVIATALNAVWVAVLFVALTTMSYTLSPPLSVGASKFGDALKVTAPVWLLILKSDESGPPSSA